MFTPILRSIALLVVVCFFAGATPADGVKLANKDARTYRLYVKHRNSAVHTSISANTTTHICSSSCTIKIKDSGTTIDAKAGERITIRNGKFVRVR